MVCHEYHHDDEQGMTGERVQVDTTIEAGARLVQVSYSRLFSSDTSKTLPRYENERLGVTAELAGNADILGVVSELANRVTRMYQQVDYDRGYRADLVHSIQELEQQKRLLAAQVRSLLAAYARIGDYILPHLFPADMPQQHFRDLYRSLRLLASLEYSDFPATSLDEDEVRFRQDEDEDEDEDDDGEVC
jgi:hypothetical protein